MKKLPKRITNEIRRILEGCRDGKLQHNQADFHCGTAHCIAGWKVVFDYAKENGVSVKSVCHREATVYTDFARKQIKGDENYPDWQYAKEQWSLTKWEAYLLFVEHTTLDAQFELLEKLERGARLQ